MGPGSWWGQLRSVPPGSAVDTCGQRWTQLRRLLVLTQDMRQVSSTGSCLGCVDSPPKRHVI